VAGLCFSVEETRARRERDSTSAARCNFAAQPGSAWRNSSLCSAVLCGTDQHPVTAGLTHRFPRPARLDVPTHIFRCEGSDSRYVLHNWPGWVLRPGNSGRLPARRRTAPCHRRQPVPHRVWPTLTLPARYAVEQSRYSETGISPEGEWIEKIVIPLVGRSRPRALGPAVVRMYTTFIVHQEIPGLRPVRCPSAAPGTCARSMRN